MAASSESLESSASRYISNPRFHRTFTLPATTEHAELTFGYSDVGQVHDAADASPNPPTILFMPGMFSSRYLGIAMHAIAEKMGVRILVVDRPGMGKSTEVPLPQRIPVWVEMVPRFLEHLHIQHVALMSHSSGAMYLLNTLHQCRSILHPERPFVALLAPWADPSHSRVTAMQMAQYVPVSAFSVWHLIPQFFVLKAGPAFASSGAVFNKASGIIPGLGGGQDNSDLEKSRRKIESHYGIPRDLQLEIEKQTFTSMFKENTVGANDEALQCLRKGQDWSWVKCDDYSLCIREIIDNERKRNSEGDTNTRPKLKVMTYFAEQDSLVGKKGQAYVEECWKGKQDGEFRDVLDFETTPTRGTDHDTVLQSIDILEAVFVNAGGTMSY